MSFEIDFRGGRGSGNGGAFTGDNNTYVYDSVAYPTGNPNYAGSVLVNIDGIYPTSASGVVSAQVVPDSGGQVRLHVGTLTMNFRRNTAAGGVITQASPSFTWAGGLCGYFAWSTYPLAPATISTLRTGRDVTVSWTAPTSDGGNALTGYRVRYSTDGGTTWSASTVVTSGLSHTYTSLPGNLTYVFQVLAANARGIGAGISATAVYVPSGGKVSVGGAWEDGAWQVSVGGAWKDAIVKASIGGVWKDAL